MVGETSNFGPYGRIAYGLTMASLGICTVLGYSIFLLAIWGKRELQKRSIFIFSLAVSDLLIVFGHVITLVVSSFHPSWPFSDLACQVNAFFGMAPTLVSIANVALIAYHAYNKECGKDCDYVNYGFYLATVWVSGLVAGVLPMLGIGSYGFESKMGIACLLDFDKTGIVAYICLLSVLWFVLPLYVVVKYYGKVEQETGDGMMLKLVSAQMIISWTPYTVCSILHLLLGPNNLPLLPMTIMSNICAKIGLATNPFLYILTDTKLRVACCKLLWERVEKAAGQKDRSSQKEE